MKGERYDFHRIIKLKNNTKVWIEQKYRKSDLFTIKNIHYGINFIIEKNVSKKWLSFFLQYRSLEFKMKNDAIKIYEWLSSDEYLIRGIERLRNNIEVALILGNKAEFITATSEYNNWIKEVEKRKLKIFEL